MFNFFLIKYQYLTRFLNINIFRVSDKYKQDYLKDFSSSVYVPPEIINYEFTKFFHQPSEYRFENSKSENRKRLIGLVCAGIWDISKKKFNRTNLFLDFKNVFINNMNWEYTKLYKLAMNRFTRNQNIRGSSSWEEFKITKIKEWEDLYHDIKTNGYKDSGNLKKPSSAEIEVGITRKGKLVLIDGKHRLAIAQILELDQIPIIINLVHAIFYKKLLKNISNEQITPQYLINYIIKKNNCLKQ
jgi:hypothetical protein